MPELGPMMRAFELQKLIEHKVTEWRERSARVSGASVAESYQQPLHFKRHTNRRKNSAEINRIIAKYSRPNKRPDERRYTVEKCPEEAPVRPARHKKLVNKLKFSQSEDNLANIGVMDTNPDPTEEIKAPPRSKLSKYKTKSCEDVTAFVDFNHTVKSKHFEENSILNAKNISKDSHALHSIGEDYSDIFEDSGISLRQKPRLVTSTPISNRKTCPAGDSVSVFEFEKCVKYSSVSDLQKGSSVPDIHSRISVGSDNTLDARKRWKLIRPPFRKGTFDCLLRWRGKKSAHHQTK